MLVVLTVVFSIIFASVFAVFFHLLNSGMPVPVVAMIAILVFVALV